MFLWVGRCMGACSGSRVDAFNPPAKIYIWDAFFPYERPFLYVKGLIFLNCLLICIIHSRKMYFLTDKAPRTT